MNNLLQDERIESEFIKKSLSENLNLRLGILLIIIGLLWLAKITGLLTSGFFAPLLMIIAGIWFISVYFVNKYKNKYKNWCLSMDWQQNDIYGL